MAKKKKELMSSAPWRGDDDESDIFEDAKMKITRQPGSDPTLHVPAKKSAKKSGSDYDDDEPVFDPELRYSFQRNMQFLGRVFTVDTLVKPLPPVMAYNVSRNINFFLRIFTQFWDEDGIANAQKSLGLGQEDRDRRLH